MIESKDDGGTLTYSYYSSGNLKQTNLDGVAVASTTFDVYGNQTSLTEPNSGTTNYSYNALGQIIEQTDNVGNTYTMTYDEFGRVLTTIGPDGTTTQAYVQSGNGLGEKLSVTAPNGIITSYAYDAFNRPTEKTENLGNETFVTGFEYDQYNNNSAITYPSGFRVENTYDKHVLTQVSNSTFGNIWTAGKLNSKGRFTEYTLGNGIQTNVSYDKYGLPTGIQSGGVQDMEYTIDPTTGNLLSREDNIKGLKEDFQYDILDRLISGQVSNTITGAQLPPLTMSYASNGNIDTKSDVGAYTYDNTKINAVTSVTNAQNVISTIQQDITYTPFKMVSTIAEDDYNSTFTYDAFYSRKKMEVFNAGNLEKPKYYSGMYEKEIIGSNTKEINYIIGGDGVTAVVLNDMGTENIYYTYKDFQGTIQTLTDETGAVTFEQNFDAWGKQRNAFSWDYSTLLSTNFEWLRGYTGHEHLKEYALINMNGRLYDPTLGRMFSPDNFVQNPAHSQSHNRYSYVFNNPLKYNDPSGQIAGSTYGGQTASASELGGGRMYYYIDGVIPVSAGFSDGFYSNLDESTGGASYHAPVTSTSYTSVYIPESGKKAFIGAHEGKKNNALSIDFKMTAYGTGDEAMNNLHDTHVETIINGQSSKTSITGKQFKSLYNSQSSDFWNWLPVAKAFSIDVDAVVGIGANGGGGAFIILQGTDAGNVAFFGDIGDGKGLDLSISFKETNIWYTGDIDNFRSSTLYGKRLEGSIGVTISHVDLSGSYFRSDPDIHGERTIGVSLGVGLGALPIWFSGGWNYGKTMRIE